MSIWYPPRNRLVGANPSYEVDGQTINCYTTSLYNGNPYPSIIYQRVNGLEGFTANDFQTGIQHYEPFNYHIKFMLLVWF